VKNCVGNAEGISHGQRLVAAELCRTKSRMAYFERSNDSSPGCCFEPFLARELRIRTRENHNNSLIILLVVQLLMHRRRMLLIVYHCTATPITCVQTLLVTSRTYKIRVSYFVIQIYFMICISDQSGMEIHHQTAAYSPSCNSSSELQPSSSSCPVWYSVI
jgi:hypothetical protein